MKNKIIKFKINSCPKQIHVPVHVILEVGQTVGVQIYKLIVQSCFLFNADCKNIVMIIAICSWR